MILNQYHKYYAEANKINDEQLMEHMLNVFNEFYQQNSVQMRHIGKIRDVLERRTNEHIRLNLLEKVC